MQVKRVLGTRVDLVTREETLEMIRNFLAEKTFKTRVLVTAYSEFFVTARHDRDFRMALESADLIIPDGIGPLAAIFFRGHLAPADGVLTKLIKGLATGVNVLRGKVGQPVSGYWLFGELIGKASDEGWKVYLLGGFGDTAALLAEKIRAEHPGIQIEFDSGAAEATEMKGAGNEKVIEKINRFKPDLLFVAYGPVKQEKWLMKYSHDLRSGVAVGVGGTFDEALGLVKEAPEVFSRYGIKWIWRLLQQPRRLPRIFKATFVFAWLVFVDSLRKK